MLQKNSALIMERLKPSDVVLDIGGWAHPFNRANYVLDLSPFETRGYYNRTFARENPFPPLGGTVEYFTRDTWITRDICSREPYPFRDKEIDFVVCSHTLEDIRDPLWVCSEMIRIAKAGYIEVPSRIFESSRGAEPGIAGLTHHRWLIDIEGNSIRFLQKLHSVHRWRFSLPKSILRNLSEEQAAQWLFWEGSFAFSEMVLHGDEVYKELERFVAQTRPHPQLLLKMNHLHEALFGYGSRAVDKARRLLRSAALS